MKEKIAIVTGLGREQGMAYGIAKVLAREGATIIGLDILEGVHNRVNELQAAGYPATGYKIDLTKHQETQTVVTKIIDEFGRIDVLVNVAGLGPMPWQTLLDMTEEEWDLILAVNLKTNFNVTKAVVPTMIKQGGGKIVNISSVTGPMVSDPACTHYAAAKGGVSGLTKALAVELAPYKINVNAICPGYVDTGIYGENTTKMSETIPLGRMGTPEEVGDLVLFLATDDSKYITGTDIIFDGGTIIQELKRVP
jgi:3-oxoacyl-[acyl-carrier protein] reductase